MSTGGHPGDGWPRAIPEGGVKGGEIVAAGTPEQVVQEERSFTGAYLRPLLERTRSNSFALSEVEGEMAEADGSASVLGTVEAPKRGRRKKVIEAAE